MSRSFGAIFGDLVLLVAFCYLDLQEISHLLKCFIISLFSFPIAFAIVLPAIS